MRKFIYSVLLFIFLSFSSKVSAQCVYDPACGCMRDASTQNECINSITTAVSFLRITPDSRAGGMGDAGIAIEGDAGSMYNNASMLAFSKKKSSLTTTYTPWLRALGLTDVYMAYVAGYTKLNDLQAIGGSLRYFSIGNIDYTDENGSPLGSGRPNEFELTGAYSRKLSDKLSAAVGLKFIYSFLASDLPVNGNDIKPGIAGATDISFSYRTPIGQKDNTFTAGLALTNLGTKISYTKNNQEYIPANLGIGAAYTWNFDEYNSLTLTSDITKLLVPTPQPPNIDNYDKDGDGIPDYKQYNVVSSWIKSFSDAPGNNGSKLKEELSEIMLSVGTEYWYNNQFAIRAGYFRESKFKGNRQYLTLGLGVKYNVFGMNMSYLVPTASGNAGGNPLANTLRFSLIFDFDDANSGN